jgi:hypothetical protein
MPGKAALPPDYHRGTDRSINQLCGRRFKLIYARVI